MDAETRRATALATLIAAIRPLAFSAEDNPPPGVQPEHWREAVIAAREALRAGRAAVTLIVDPWEPERAAQ